MFLMVAGVWFWEAFYQKNDFSQAKITLWRIILLLFALFAFWRPESSTNWNPANILTSNSAISFCSITPLYIAILLLFFPRINLVVLRITSSVGLIIAIYNVVLKSLSWKYNYILVWNSSFTLIYIVNRWDNPFINKGERTVTIYLHKQQPIYR